MTEQELQEKTISLNHLRATLFDPYLRQIIKRMRVEALGKGHREAHTLGAITESLFHMICLEFIDTHRREGIPVPEFYTCLQFLHLQLEKNLNEMYQDLVSRVNTPDA